MRHLAKLWLVPLWLWGGTYYAKLEPIDAVTLKAAAAGSVTAADRNDEGKTLHGEKLVQIDDATERIELNKARDNLNIVRRLLALNEEALEVDKEAMRRQKRYFERMNALSTASQTQKDNAFNAYASARNRYDARREKILSLQQQIRDLTARIATLEDTIGKKSVQVEGYVARLDVRAGDYVAPGTPLARIVDTHRAKLVFFVPYEELADIKNKTVYLDGNATAYRVSKVWCVTDDTYLSSYRVEIDIDTPQKTFGTLMKVELK